MSAKFTLSWPTTSTVFAVLRNTSYQVYYIVGDVMETWAGGAGRTAADYDVQADATPAYGLHTFTVPTGLAAGNYIVQMFEQAGATAADSDCVYAIGNYDLNWSGSSIISLPGLLVGGDYAVSLTIRTTAGAAVGGVQVWLSIDGDRSNPVTTTKVTNASGVVTFYLDYTTYYVHCSLSTYTFVTASFTAASGSVTFVKDIATLISSGADSDYDESFITRALEVCRKGICEPTINKNNSDNYLIRRMEAAYGLILGEKQRNSNRPIVATLEIDMVSGQYDYAIPETLGPIVSVFSDSGVGTGYKLFYYNYSPFNVGGQGVWVEGNLLRIATNFPTSTPIKIEAMPNGTARLHRGICTINADGDEVTLGATPNKGTLDTTVNGLAGSMFRVLKVTGTSPTGNNIQSLPIRSYNATTRVATLACPLSPIPVIGAGGSIYYEIMPQMPVGLDMLPALYVAWEVNSTNGNLKRAKGCQDSYNNNMRHLRLQAFYSRVDTAALVDSDSYLNGENQGYTVPYSSIAGIP